MTCVNSMCFFFIESKVDQTQNHFKIIQLFFCLFCKNIIFFYITHLYTYMLYFRMESKFMYFFHTNSLQLIIIKVCLISFQQQQHLC